MYLLFLICIFINNTSMNSLICVLSYKFMHNSFAYIILIIFCYILIQLE